MKEIVLPFHLSITLTQTDVHWVESQLLDLGHPTLADAICDRVVHHAHRIELKGESMRKVRAKPAQEG